MDQRHRDLSSVARVEGSIVFSEAEYSTDVGKVIAHAAATGSAVIESADGRRRVVISIPIVDLPTLRG